MTQSKIILYIPLLMFGSIQAHDFYHAQSLIQQVTPENFHYSWDFYLETTLQDAYNSRLHRTRTLELITAKQHEFKKLKKIDIESYIKIGICLPLAAHMANYLITSIETIELCSNESDTCSKSLFFPFESLTSYATRKKLLYQTSQVIALPFLLYALYIDRYNSRIDHAVAIIERFRNNLR